MKRIAIVVALCIGCWAGTAKAVTQPSGTLPVVYVSTNNQSINDTENYVAATVWIDALSTGQEGLGSASAPVTAQIKGRGNWTWRGFDKKPYKLKLDSKKAVLGMPKNKHWCLMAGADDNLGYLRNTAGFAISAALGMRWTPGQVPVELVLNGDYMGLYFVTEQIKIDKNRVNITAQDDEITHPDSITGGWLVEIDNYEEAGNVELEEHNGEKIMITPKEPEVLSARQRDYLTTQMNLLNDAIYNDNDNSLEGLIDMTEAARFYLIQEILYDCESYHGSCYLHKDIDQNGTTEKWFFGPVWDFGNAYRNRVERFVYDEPEFSQIWIGRLAQHPAFQQKVAEQWYIYLNQCDSKVREEINQFASRIATAAKADRQRWQNSSNVADNSDMARRKQKFINLMDWRIGWLKQQWGNGTKPQTALQESEQETSAKKRLENGVLVLEAGGKRYNLLGQEVR